MRPSLAVSISGRRELGLFLHPPPLLGACVPVGNVWGFVKILNNGKRAAFHAAQRVCVGPGVWPRHLQSFARSYQRVGRQRDYMNHGVFSKTGCNLKDGCCDCRKKAEVRYAISPAYFVVMGSPQSESVEAQFSLVKLRI